MTRFSLEHDKRRVANKAALATFGVDAETESENLREIHKGDGPDVFTIGYERRDGEDMVARLLDNCIDVLIDVRQRAMSRKADFRGKALAARCEDAGIRYIAMPSLGSNDELRDQLRETGDFKRFARRFRTLAKRSMGDPLEELASLAEESTIAMICYERCHDECHRSILAEELHKRIDASVHAIK